MRKSPKIIGTKVENGVTIQIIAPRKVRKSEKTFPCMAGTVWACGRNKVNLQERGFINFKSTTYVRK